MPTIWPSMCPMGFHKTIEASDGIFETQRNAHYSSYRRAAGVKQQSPQSGRVMKDLRFILEDLGFVLNLEKSVTTPTQSIGFLGLVIDPRTMQISLPGEKIKQIQMEAVKLLQMLQVCMGMHSDTVPGQAKCRL